MEMKKIRTRALAMAVALVMALMLVPGISFADELTPELQAAYDALEIPNADDIRGNITLPQAGENGSVITWSVKSENKDIITVTEEENENYDPIPAGVVTRGDKDETVTLAANITIGEQSVEKVFDLTVRAKAQQPELSKYVMYYFKGDWDGAEKIWLAASEDGLHWNTLNYDAPIIESFMGEQGLRDPYILRSPEGDKFYLIATDLKVTSNGWDTNQTNGSKSIMVWESSDLIHWSDQRMVRVATDDMGCAWAPEATYDEKTGEYVVYWSSKIRDESGNYGVQTVSYAKTRDFVTFTEPKTFINRDPNLEDDIVAVIDTTIIKNDKGYYRFVKNERDKRVFLEFSDQLLGQYTGVKNNVYTDEQGIEGPEIYQLNDGRYCLILDNYGNGGYFPYVTDDLESETYTKLDTSEYSFPTSPRHGVVMRISDEEYNSLIKKYGGIMEIEAQPVQPDEHGSDPIIEYDFTDGAKDISGNGYDGALKGGAAIVEDEEKGSVLSLDGAGGTYLELPEGALDGRNSMTISMDVNSAMNGGNYFTFALGQNQNTYLFIKVNSNGVKAAITTDSYGAEEIAEYSDSDTTLVGSWHNITVTIDPKTMAVYVDGAKKAAARLSVNCISKLGTDTVAYIGRSFYTADSYAAMKVDNVRIYNYAMTAVEVADAVPGDDTTRYSLNINAAEKGADIENGMIGLFFEDINTAADGGLYSEVINNRSFEAYSYPEADNKPIPDFGWSKVGEASTEYLSENPLNKNNPTYLRLTASAAGQGVQNDCYSGFSAKSGDTYKASVYARGNYDGSIEYRIIGDNEAVIGSGSFSGLTDEFKKYEFDVKVIGSCKNATVQVLLDKAGSVDLDMISMLPSQTFNGRDNGLRPDLVELLAQIHPGFLRFPGGCIIEGYNLDNRYQWKQSVGPVEQRVQNWNRWQDHNEGDNRYGYCQTYGLGFYEYFLLCEDIGAKAVPVVNVGIGCQYQTGDYSTREELFSIYIQDALDLIQFANGDPDANWDSIDYTAVDTADPATFNGNWANLRALMGHPASFNMEYIGIGNEQWDTSEYVEGEDGWAETGNNFFKRYEAFEKAIHEVDPEMKLISTSGPSSDGDDFTKAWNWLETHKDDKNFTYAVDEHYYKDPQWFYDNINRYDNYDRDGFYVFAGEYASRWWSSNPRGNTVETALSEAAYMTALERNSDIVKMASYAPLFAKTDGTQWTPDMIWFDSDTAYGTPDYYVQQLFARNSGSYNLSGELSDAQDDRVYKGYTGLGTWNTQASFKDFKVTDDVTGEDITPESWFMPEAAPEKYDYEVTASSEPESANGKDNVKDGDLNTRWAADGKDQWLLCDLGEVKTVGKVGVATFVSSGREYYYAIQASVDGENYETIYDGTNGMENGNIVYTMMGNKEYRYIKILAKGNSFHNWNGVTEVEILGECEQVHDSTFDSTGTWDLTDGVFTQSSEVSGAYLFADRFVDTDSYTISFTATKTGGDEGFLVPFMVKDAKNFYFWNIAGWGNTMSAFQQSVNGSNTTVSDYEGTVLENDKEYSITLTVDGSDVKGYIDGELVSHADLMAKTVGPVYENTIYDEATGDIIIKLVNSSGTLYKVPISISGAEALTGKATQYILEGYGLLEKNSIDDPENICVERSEISGISDNFTYDLTGYTVAVLRVHTKAIAVESADTVVITAQSGQNVQLPEKVDVKLADGTVAAKQVSWMIPESGVLVNDGEFKVYGRIEGSEVDAEAIVKLGSDERAAIEVLEAVFKSGARTTVAFNPSEEGIYKGIMAIYGENGLESVQTVEFTGTEGAMDIQLAAESAGKTVKFMLWNGEDLVPVTKAEIIDIAE